ncbi:MAG: esterase family protein, partial [Saprospiraceae bacterium]|nr:esterase family protein [Saprospiraceae bacterium]
NIVRYNNFQSELISTRNIDVWLPSNYDEHKKYAVLYMQDGQMLFDATTTWNNQEWGVDETMNKLILEGKIRDCIVVGIWNANANRHAEYFPQKPYNYLSQEKKAELMSLEREKGVKYFNKHVYSNQYLKFIVKELKPFIDSHFSTIRGREGTFIAGSSMGGLISLYAVMQYPKVFGGAACISTHWIGVSNEAKDGIPDAFCRYIERRIGKCKDTKFYFDYGTETLDKYYEEYQKRVDAIFLKNNFDKNHFQSMKFEGADHSEKSWNARFEIPVTFLLGN